MKVETTRNRVIITKEHLQIEVFVRWHHMRPGTVKRPGTACQLEVRKDGADVENVKVQALVCQYNHLGRQDQFVKKTGRIVSLRKALKELYLLSDEEKAVVIGSLLKAPYNAPELSRKEFYLKERAEARRSMEKEQKRELARFDRATKSHMGL
jgi:hypothetical protein